MARFYRRISTPGTGRGIGRGASALLGMAVLLAGIVSTGIVGTTPAWAAVSAPVITNPGNQVSPTGVALTLRMTASMANNPSGRLWWSATGLPLGLLIDPASGVIAGIPLLPGTYNTTVSATDTSQNAAANKHTGSTSFTWTTGVIVNAPGVTGTATGAAGSLTVAARGGLRPYKWSATGLPTGLSINRSTGVISGTARTPGRYAVTVTATDLLGVSGKQALTWTVGTAPVVTNPGAQTSPIGVALRLSLSASTANAPSTWSATGLPAGLAIDPSTGVVSGTPTAAGTSSVTIVTTDSAGIAGTASFTWTTGVVVSNPGSPGNQIGTSVSFAAYASGGTLPYTWSATGLPPGLSMNTSTGVVSGTPTAVGGYATKITATDATKTAGTTSFTWTIVTPITVTNPGAQTSPAGLPVTTKVTAAGGSGPYAWSALGLPPGLAIDASTGVISGTPSVAGSYTATVTATGAFGMSASTWISWQVAPALMVIDPGTRNSLVGVPESVTLAASGGATPYTWAATGLPAGLTIDPSTGVVSGTPTGQGTATVQVTVTDAANQTASLTITWVTSVATPQNVAASASGAQAVDLSWDAVPGAAGYQLYRNGSLVFVTGTWPGVVDSGLDPGTTYWYQVKAVDGDGDASNFSDAVTVSTAAAPAAPVNYARCGAPGGQPGCDYVASVPADAASPDTGGVSLADAVRGAGALGPAWQGRTDAYVYSFTIDLGAARPITEIDSTWLQVKSQWAILPASLTYLVSTDGQNFQPVAYIARPNTGDADQTSTYRALGLSTTARYVRVELDGTGGLTATDEMQVRGTAPDGPASPSGLTASANGAQAVDVSWQNVPGATGYQLYRDGALVYTTGTWPGVVDSGLDPGTTYQYQVKAIDGHGYTSDLSASASATTAAAPAAPVNYARCGAAGGQPGCNYVASVPADAANPDTGGASLTDGVRGTAAPGPAWQGRTNAYVYSFTIDLGTARPITEIDSTWLQVKSQWVILPASLTYLVSTDGQNFQPVAYIARPNTSDADQTSTYRALGLNTTAQYVRVELDGTGGMTATDEMQVRGTTPLVPAAPSGLTASASGAQTVDLSWQAVPGAAAYQLYRDDALVYTAGTWPGVVDSGLDPGTTYRYQVRTVDGDGNVSNFSDTVTVATQVVAAGASVNYARCGAADGQPGCGYVASVPADTANPDTGGASLTDGVRGTAALGPAWQSRTDAYVYSFTIDLGTARPITEIDSTWLQVKSQWVILPASLTYLVSTDGQNFQPVAYIARPNTGDADQTSTYRALGLNTTARYVRVELDGTGGLTATDEMQVLGPTQ